MARNEYYGDAEYRINCTGDAVVDDEVRFERAVFTGSRLNPVYAGHEIVTGRIVRDSYGAEKQQHTFTLALPSGQTIRIKGRNLYRNGTWRKPWDNEALRRERTREKHERGNKARQDRAARTSLRDTDLRLA